MRINANKLVISIKQHLLEQTIGSLTLEVVGSRWTSLNCRVPAIIILLMVCYYSIEGFYIGFHH